MTMTPLSLGSLLNIPEEEEVALDSMIILNLDLLGTPEIPETQRLLSVLAIPEVLFLGTCKLWGRSIVTK